MKCTLLREMEQKNPEYDHAARMQAKAERKPYDVPKTITAPTGTEIDHPDAWRLVKLGVAKPSDEECQAAANLTEEEIAKRAAKYEKLNSGRATGDKRLDAPAPEGDAEADDGE